MEQTPKDRRERHGLPALALAIYHDMESTAQYIAETWVYCRRVTRTMSGLRKLQKLYLIAHDRYGDDLLARIQHYLPFEEAKRARALS